MDLGIKGKTALVTAASRGFGKAVALGLAAEGAKVAMCARAEETERRPSRRSGPPAKRFTAGPAGEVVGQALDVTDGAAVEGFRQGN